MAALLGSVAGCTGADQVAGKPPLPQYLAANNLYANMPIADFARATIVDTSSALTLAGLLGQSAKQPSTAALEAVWRTDGEMPVWKAHFLCLSPMPRDDLRSLLSSTLEPAAIQQAKKDGLGYLEHLLTGKPTAVSSLTAMASLNVLACRGERDLLKRLPLGAIATEVTGNAALTLQWLDVLDRNAQASRPVLLRGLSAHRARSSFLPKNPAARCDDRQSIEAAALLLLGAAAPAEVKLLRTCVFDQAAVSQDLQVATLAGRVLKVGGGDEQTEATAMLTERLSEVQKADGLAYNRPTVFGTLPATIAALRIMRARGETLSTRQKELILQTASRQNVDEPGNKLLTLQACVLLDKKCDRNLRDAVTDAARVVNGIQNNAPDISQILNALTAVWTLDKEAASIQVRELANRPNLSACAKVQTSAFLEAEQTGRWPETVSLADARLTFLQVLTSKSPSTYCDISWLSAMVGTPTRDDSILRSAELNGRDSDGLVRLPGQESTSLSMNAIAYDLGL